jgi:hypothetical protein
LLFELESRLSYPASESPLANRTRKWRFFRSDGNSALGIARVGRIGEWHVDFAFCLNLGKLGSYPGYLS